MIGRDLYRRAGLTRLLMGCGIATLALGVLLSVVTERIFMGLGAPILVLIMAQLRRSSPVVGVRDDHLEIRLAPLASVALVRFCDIEEVYSGLKVLELRLRPGTNEKSPIKLPLNDLEPQEGEELAKWLKERVNHADTRLRHA